MTYCRFDTPQCPEPQPCCLSHIEELKSFISDFFNQYDIAFKIDGDTVHLDSQNYARIKSLKREICKDGYCLEEKDSDPYAYQPFVLFYSNINRNCVVIDFTLNREKYQKIDNRIKNKKVLRWGYKALIDTLSNYETQKAELMRDENHLNRGMDYFISYNLNLYIHHLQDAYDILRRLRPNKQKYKFLEVGCGVGTKTKIASHLFNAFGLEVHEAYAEEAKKLMRKRVRNDYGLYHDEADEVERIIVGNALEYDDYDKYDVIYFYRLMHDYDQEVALENRIYEQMKFGAVVIPVWKQGPVPEFIRETSRGAIYVKMENEGKFKKLEKFIQRNFTGRG